MKSLAIVITSLFLFGCGTETSEAPSIDSDNGDNTSEEQQPEETHVFEAEIKELQSETSAIIFADTIQGYPSGAEISVILPDNEEWEEGDRVQVEHDGVFLESHPMSIMNYTIEKVE